MTALSYVFATMIFLILGTGPCIHRIGPNHRIGQDRTRNWLFSSFLKHFFIIIMFIKYVYDHSNDVWIIKVGDDSYYLTGSGPKNGQITL